MRPKLFPASLIFCLLGALIIAAPTLRAQSSDMKLEAQLLWGTNDRNSPNPSHKPVEEDIRKKLAELPLKWTNYFEVHRSAFTVASGATEKVSISKKCQLEVKSLGKTEVQVSLFGKGEQVLKRVQKLPKGEMLVLGGDAPNATSWLVVLKRLQ